MTIDAGKYTATAPSNAGAALDDTIRPFMIDVPEGELVDLRRRIAATRWPVFPGEIYRAPKSWVERSYHKLIHFNEVDKGGHFAAWEQPAVRDRAPGRVSFPALTRGTVTREVS